MPRARVRRARRRRRKTTATPRSRAPQRASLKALAGCASKRRDEAVRARATARGVRQHRRDDRSIEASAEGRERSRRKIVEEQRRERPATRRAGRAGCRRQGADRRAESRAFIVASTVKKIEITKGGGQTQIACTVAVRVAPWSGSDGGERWEANQAASAIGLREGDDRQPRSRRRRAACATASRRSPRTSPPSGRAVPQAPAQADS